MKRSPARIIGLVVLGILVIVVLFTVVFPWVERRTQNPTLGTVSAATLATVSQVARAPR